MDNWIVSKLLVMLTKCRSLPAILKMGKRICLDIKKNQLPCKKKNNAQLV